MNHSKPKVTIFVRCSPTCNWLIINSTKQITSLSCLIKYNANSFSWRLYKQVVLHKAPAHHLRMPSDIFITRMGIWLLLGWCESKCGLKG